MRVLLLSFLFTALSLSSICYGRNIETWDMDEQGAWVLDKENSTVSFDVDFLVFSKVKGKVNEFEAKLGFVDNDISSSQLDVVIAASSIDTENKERNADIHSEEFFDVLQYPHIYFTVDEIQSLKREKYVTKVLVTLKGVTRQADFFLEYKGIELDPQTGQEKAKLKLYGKLDRLEYGMRLSSFLEAGGIFLGKMIYVDCTLEFLRAE